MNPYCNSKGNYIYSEQGMTHSRKNLCLTMHINFLDSKYYYFMMILPPNPNIHSLLSQFNDLNLYGHCCSIKLTG